MTAYESEVISRIVQEKFRASILALTTRIQSGWGIFAIIKSEEKGRNLSIEKDSLIFKT